MNRTIQAKSKPPSRPSAAMKKKAAAISSILDELFPNPQSPLFHTNAFTLLIAVLLSAQNRDDYVNRVTPILFAKADHAAAMAKLPVEEILSIIRICSFAPTKSKAIHNLSKLLVEKHGGEVPASFEALEELPGIGHKSASVVMSQAFGVPAFPVDTHIFRLAWRWGLSDGKNVEKTEADLKAVFPKEKWSKLHLQLIYFGRQYCPALRHLAEKCPICSQFGRKELFVKG